MTEAEAEAAAPIHCERCDAETRHPIKYIGMDNRPHYVCWTCVSREEKRDNLKRTWKRGGRAAAGASAGRGN